MFCHESPGSALYMRSRRSSLPVSPALGFTPPWTCQVTAEALCLVPRVGCTALPAFMAITGSGVKPPGSAGVESGPMCWLAREGLCGTVVVLQWGARKEGTHHRLLQTRSLRPAMSQAEEPGEPLPVCPSHALRCPSWVPRPLPQVAQHPQT